MNTSIATSCPRCYWIDGRSCTAWMEDGDFDLAREGKCPRFLPIVYAITNWSKSRIIDVAARGGANQSTVDRMRSIPLADLRAILLRPERVALRGEYLNPYRCRHTVMLSMDWGIIDAWNEEARA